MESNREIVPEQLRHGSKEVHRLLRENRVWMEKRIDNWNSIQDIEKDANRYAEVAFDNLSLVRCKTYIDAELPLLKRILDRLEVEFAKDDINVREAQLKYLHTAKKILMIHGLGDLLNSDSGLLTDPDPCILEGLKDKTKKEECLKIIEDNITDLKSDLEVLRKDNRLADEGREANQLEDPIEMEESYEQKNKEAMIKHVRSLNEQLASFNSTMCQIADRCKNLKEPRFYIRSSIDYCQRAHWLYKDCEEEGEEASSGQNPNSNSRRRKKNQKKKKKKEKVGEDDKETQPENQAFLLQEPVLV